MKLRILCFLMMLGGGLISPSLYAQEQAVTPAPSASKDETAALLIQLKKEAEAGDPRAAYQLWMRYEFEGNAPVAREWNGRYLALLVKKAESADLPSMLELAKLYMQGTEAIPPNLEAARNWFYLAAQAGDADSMYQFAHMVQNGLGGDKNEALANEWFAKAYVAMEQQMKKAANPHSAYWLGVMLQKGVGIEKNLPKALSFYEQSASLGHPRAQILAAIMYRDGVGCTKDNAKALAWFEKAATHGDCGAMMEIAFAYLQGKQSYPQNTAKALEYLNKAAQLNDPYALRELGAIYAEGILLPKDEAKALAFYQEATLLGEGDSAVALAKLLKQQGKEDDAFSPLRRAAQEMNSPAAAYELSLLYGDKKDRKEADLWMRRAAEAGYPLALVPYAYLQLDPTSHVSWNPLQAYQWFKIADERGQENAQLPMLLLSWVMIPLLVLLVLYGIYLLHRRIKKMMAAQEAEAEENATRLEKK